MAVHRNQDEIKGAFKKASFAQHVGLAIEDVREGYAKLSLECRDEVMQLNGAMHGGALATLADTAVAIALATLLGEGQRSTTVEMKINYLLPILRGKATAEARIIKKGQRTAVGEVDIFDADGKLAGKSLMTYMVLQK